MSVEVVPVVVSMVMLLVLVSMVMLVVLGNGGGVSGGGVGQCCCLVPQVSVSTAAGGWWCNCWAIPDYPALEPLSDCRLKFVTELWVRIRMIAVVKYEKEIFDQM